MSKAINFAKDYEKYSYNIKKSMEKAYENKNL
jgi:hypothetical protein